MTKSQKKCIYKFFLKNKDINIKEQFDLLEEYYNIVAKLKKSLWIKYFPFFAFPKPRLPKFILFIEKMIKEKR